MTWVSQENSLLTQPRRCPQMKDQKVGNQEKPPGCFGSGWRARSLYPPPARYPSSSHRGRRRTAARSSPRPAAPPAAASIPAPRVPEPSPGEGRSPRRARHLWWRARSWRTEGASRTWSPPGSGGPLDASRRLPPRRAALGERAATVPGPGIRGVLGRRRPQRRSLPAAAPAARRGRPRRELRRPRLRDTTRETAAARGWGPACAPPRSQLPGGLEGRSRALRTRGSRVSAPDSLLTAVRLAWGRCSGRPTLTCSFSNQPLGPRKQLRPWDQAGVLILGGCHWVCVPLIRESPYLMNALSVITGVLHPLCLHKKLTILPCFSGYPLPFTNPQTLKPLSTSCLLHTACI
jgi:hypothetical protein